MKCPTCGYLNRDTARFCGECASPLARELRCPGCESPNPVGQRFCNSCAHALPAQPARVAGPAARPPRSPEAYTPPHLAEKILTTRSALEGERKQVTVLFADVKGSAELTESLDPEELHRVMDRFFSILSEGVHRFEGTINQYTGDGIMALFGAPVAHEDHAQRACYAALQLTQDLRRYADELRRTRGLNFAVRMGLDSGEVVVGKIGDDLRMDYTAQGYCVSLAARMEQLAEPGSVYVTESTEGLARGLFRFHDLGAFDLKGIERPARVYRLESAGPLRSSMEVARGRGFSRFVGREAEMGAFEAALARTFEGNGQVLALIGEAGVGKSRLCFEFLERCRTRGLRVLELHGVPHGRNIPLLPILEFLRTAFGIHERDSDQMAREKIAGRLLLLDEAFRADLPVVFDFLGVPDPERPLPPRDPEGLKRQLFTVVKRIVQTRSRREPAVILIEDLHWLDRGSEDFVENLIDAVPGTRTLALANFRPEYEASWFHRSYFQQLPLPPLPPTATDELMQELLGEDESLAPLLEQIRERTRGNPFFIEEIVRSLADRGVLRGQRAAYRLAVAVRDIALPPTVHAVLAARIDRLPERQKHLVQTAAVIGEEFSHRVLQRVSALPEPEFHEEMRSLIDGEFLEERSLYPDPEYGFRHPLTQEVAYRSQLGAAKAPIHAEVARVMSDVFAERLEERAALIAHHWEGAEQPAEVARWSRRAAEWVGIRDPSESLQHWRRVREALASVPPSSEALELGLAARVQTLRYGALVGIEDEEAGRVFAEGRGIAEETGDARSLAILVSNYGTVRGSQGQVEEHYERSLEAVQLAERTGDRGVRLALRQPVAFCSSLVGKLRDALQLTNEALDLSGEDPTLGKRELGFSPYIWFMGFRGVLLNAMGRPEEGARDLDHALDLAREHDESETLVWTHGGYADLGFFTGEPQMALGHCRRGVSIAEKFGSPYWCAAAYTWLGHAYVLNEQWGQALAALEQALAVARTRRTVLEIEARMLCHLAQAHLGAGNLEEARTTAAEAVDVARQRRTRWYQCRAELTLAHVLARTEGIQGRPAIENALRLASALAAETGASGFEPFIYLERAELGRLAGDRAACERDLRSAQRLFESMGATGHVERLAKALTPFD